MPKIKPFRAVRYNTAKIRDIASVIAPPYDVISPTMQQKLYGKHPCNVIRLILGKSSGRDTPSSNRYTRARDLFDKWYGEGILIHDHNPAVYFYSQKYTYNKKTIDRTGFIALMDLEPGGKDRVLAHENTLAAPKMDRLKLTRSTEANLEPIFVLYEDPRRRVMRIFNTFKSSSVPVLDFKFESVRNRLWKLEDPALIKEIEGLMRPKNTFIADGHHRFETARNYHTEVMKKSSSRALKENSRFLMVYFVESDERALTILPAHRAVRDIKGLKKDQVLTKLQKYFVVKKVRGLKNMMASLARGSGGHSFGLYLGRGDTRVLTLKSLSESDRSMKKKPIQWKHLDVSILHSFIIQHVLGLSDADDNVEFIKDPSDTIKAVDSGRARIAFFLNPTKASQVRSIARIGERMPRKATYFYPKPVSGLVINKF